MVSKVIRTGVALFGPLGAGLRSALQLNPAGQLGSRLDWVRRWKARSCSEQRRPNPGKRAGRERGLESRGEAIRWRHL